MTKERFTLISELGRGGMGVVWKARDGEASQIVALKLLRETYAEDPEYLARFERELELARRIDSVHVVKVLGFGVRKKVPYLALEYVEGPSLHDALLAHGPYTWDETQALLAQLAQGLADANAAGVIHRDVKPSNVLMAPDGTAKLTDFGIARGLDLTRFTATSTVLGTPAYLAPEGPKDARSDLYSLGIIGYELLTGATPFKGTSYQEIIVEHIRTAPDLDKLPPEARGIIGWLLAKDPADRPQSAGALLPVLFGAAAPGAAQPRVQESDAAVEVSAANPVALPRSGDPIRGSVFEATVERRGSAPTGATARPLRSRSAVPMGLMGLLALIVLAGATAISGVLLTSRGAEATPSARLAPSVSVVPATDGPTNQAVATAVLYTVRAGDYFARIAATARVTLDQLLAANPGIDPNKIEVGQQIIIPSASVSGPAASSQGSPVSMAPSGIVSPGVLTVCMDVVNPPQSSYDTNGMPIGSDVELANEIAARLGLSLSVRNTAFDQTIPDLVAEKCDTIISSQLVSPAREKQVDMLPYLRTAQGLEGISVGKSHPEIRDAIKSALESMFVDGSYLRILDKWGLGSGALAHPSASAPAP